MVNRFGSFLCCTTAISITLLISIVVLTHSPETTLASSPSTHTWPLSQPVQATPEPDSMFDPDHRLARPPMSDPPTQVELGHYQYYMSCMVCHGDRGQGLTEEWRSVLDPADQNCWQSKCHAANHPPEGFQIPRSAPPVIGTGALSAYQTAADLYAYLRVEMPWPFPGLFDDEEYWRLSAFLADANQVSWGEKPLGPDNAANVLMRPGLIQAHRSVVGSERVVAGALLVLLLGTAILHQWAQVH